MLEKEEARLNREEGVWYTVSAGKMPSQRHVPDFTVNGFCIAPVMFDAPVFFNSELQKTENESCLINQQIKIRKLFWKKQEEECRIPAMKSRREQPVPKKNS